VSPPPPPPELYINWLFVLVKETGKSKLVPVRHACDYFTRIIGSTLDVPATISRNVAVSIPDGVFQIFFIDLILPAALWLWGRISL
jgi:hypothetical protein